MKKRIETLATDSEKISSQWEQFLKDWYPYKYGIPYPVETKPLRPYESFFPSIKKPILLQQ